MWPGAFWVSTTEPGNCADILCAPRIGSTGSAIVPAKRMGLRVCMDWVRSVD